MCFLVVAAFTSYAETLDLAEQSLHETREVFVSLEGATRFDVVDLNVFLFEELPALGTAILPLLSFVVTFVRSPRR